MCPDATVASYEGGSYAGGCARSVCSMVLSFICNKRREKSQCYVTLVQDSGRLTMGALEEVESTIMAEGGLYESAGGARRDGIGGTSTARGLSVPCCSTGRRLRTEAPRDVFCPSRWRAAAEANVPTESSRRRERTQGDSGPELRRGSAHVAVLAVTLACDNELTQMQSHPRGRLCASRSPRVLISARSKVLQQHSPAPARFSFSFSLSRPAATLISYPTLPQTYRAISKCILPLCF